ncbi:MAG TPA: ferredoxin [Streptosporangiaceae bacterium]|nr:ferredoxin [Streptosporangiaceae bacterium]
MKLNLQIDPIACTGHGLCADLLPELIELDEWGYPIIGGAVPPDLAAHARRAVNACPALALRLVRTPDQLAARHALAASETRGG